MQNIGVHEDPTATPAGRTPFQVLERYPKSSIGRVFTGKPLTTIQDLRPIAINHLKPYLQAGTPTMYISFKTDITQTRNGEWNARYQELGVYIEQIQRQYGVAIVVIPWHEPEDNFTSGAAYVHYYTKVFNNIKLGSSLVKIKPCFLAYHWAPKATGGSVGGKTDNPADWFTNLNMGDGVLIDVYSGRSFPLEQMLPEHPGFARWVQFLPSDVRINLGERGWETPSSTNTVTRSSIRAFTMNREFGWLLSKDPVASRIDDYTIWSSPGAEKAIGLVMDEAAEHEIDLFLSLAFPNAEPDAPDDTHPQYQFGFDEGFASGQIDGYNAALAEVQSWATSKTRQEGS